MLGVVERRSGYNLFLQANMRAFNGEGLLYDLVHFSAGNLFLPSELQGCREGDKVRLTWKNEYVVREERLGDELWCVVMRVRRLNSRKSEERGFTCIVSLVR